MWIRQGWGERIRERIGRSKEDVIGLMSEAVLDEVLIVFEESKVRGLSKIRN